MFGPSKYLRASLGAQNPEFFYFYIIFFRFIKNIRRFFFAKMSPSRRFIRRKVGTAGSSGGSYLPPDELAVGATAVLQPAIAAL